jgi:hypothetical protein
VTWERIINDVSLSCGISGNMDNLDGQQKYIFNLQSFVTTLQLP